MGRGGGLMGRMLTGLRRFAFYGFMAGKKNVS